MQELLTLLILSCAKKYENIEELNYNIKSIKIKAFLFISVQSKLSHNLMKLYNEVIRIVKNKILQNHGLQIHLLNNAKTFITK